MSKLKPMVYIETCNNASSSTWCTRIDEKKYYAVGERLRSEIDKLGIMCLHNEMDEGYLMDGSVDLGNGETRDYSPSEHMLELADRVQYAEGFKELGGR